MQQRKLFCLMMTFILLIAAGALAAEEQLRMAHFGTVGLYRGSLHPAHVIMLVSGDEGWNEAASRIAIKMASENDSLVIGIDAPHYLHELTISRSKSCAYPAADFEALSKFVQKSLLYPKYINPILAGYNSGASLAYATLVQAPPGTFSGCISIGFCPTLRLLSRSVCKGYGVAPQRLSGDAGLRLMPVSELKDPWMVLQGEKDTACPYRRIEEFVKGVTLGDLIGLPDVDRVFEDHEAQWLPAFSKAFSGMVRTHETAVKKVEPPDALKDLPLLELPARKPEADVFAIVLSGDGGWASIDRQIGESLVARGIPVVGWNSLQYFWQNRTQQQMSSDMARVIRHYLAVWQKPGVLLIGFSLGADVLPFMVSPLPPEVRKTIFQVDLLGPSDTVDFEFHLTDWIGAISRGTDHPILPEVQKLKGEPILCFYGAEEKESLCRRLGADVATPIVLGGGHHFDGDYGPIVERIIKEYQEAAKKRG